MEPFWGASVSLVMFRQSLSRVPGVILPPAVFQYSLPVLRFLGLLLGGETKGFWIPTGYFLVDNALRAVVSPSYPPLSQ
jgi:hypothetical protein